MKKKSIDFRIPAMALRAHSAYQPIRFLVLFTVLFLLFYYFNIGFLSLTSHGRHYSEFWSHHFNYIHWLRRGLLISTAQVLAWLGFASVTNEYQLLVAGRGIIHLLYTCLGFGLMSFFAAFVLAYPKTARQKLWFLFTGLATIQILNVIRFVLLALYWKGNTTHIADHHTIFNFIIYILMLLCLYLWVKHSKKSKPAYAG